MKTINIAKRFMSLLLSATLACMLIPVTALASATASYDMDSQSTSSSDSLSQDIVSSDNDNGGKAAENQSDDALEDFSLDGSSDTAISTEDAILTAPQLVSQNVLHASSSSNDSNVVTGTLDYTAMTDTSGDLFLSIDGKKYSYSDNFMTPSWAVILHDIPVQATLNEKGEVVALERVSQVTSLKQAAASTKRSNTNSGVAANKAYSALSDNNMLTLDSNLNYYFSNDQIREFKDYLTVWAALIVIASNDRPTNLNTEIAKRVLKKMGYESYLFGLSVSASTTIKATTKNGTEVKIECDMSGIAVAFGDSDPYAGTGKLEYEIKDLKDVDKEGGNPESGTGIFAYTNMETFCDNVSTIADKAIKSAFDASWGNNANKAASMFISEPVDMILSRYCGKFSDNVYESLKKPTKNYLKECRVKCPVDVYVYDGSGDLVGSVVNNVVENDSGILITVNGDEKRFWLEGDTYTVKFVGNGSGTMEYDILEYDDDVLSRTVTTTGVPLSQSKEYKAIVCDAEYVDNGTYPLESDTGETIPLTSDTLQSTEVDDDVDLEVSDIESGQCGDNAYWYVTEAGVLHVFGTGDTYDYDYQTGGIPCTRNKVAQIVVEDGITSLGEYVFSNFTEATKAYVSNSVSVIGSSLFNGCKSLAEIDINLSNLEECHYFGSDVPAVVAYKYGIMSDYDSGYSWSKDNIYNREIGYICLNDGQMLVFGSGVLPGWDSTLRVERSDQSWRSVVTDVTISEGVTSIDGHFFDGCSQLSNVWISSTVESLGGWAFSSNDDDRDCTSLSVVAFAENSRLRTIGSYAFAGCNSLESFNLPDSVEEIAFGAFEYSSGLKEFNISESSQLRKIDGGVFCDTSMSSIYLPPTLSDISTHAFDFNLDSINVDSRNATYFSESGAIYDFDGNLVMAPAVKGVFSIREGTKNLKQASIRGDNVVSVNIATSVENVEGYAFSSCSNLTSVQFPSNGNLKSLGEASQYTFASAFQDCPLLTKISIPKTVTGFNFQETDIDEVIFEEGCFYPRGSEDTKEYSFASMPYCKSNDGVVVVQGVDNFILHRYIQDWSRHGFGRIVMDESNGYDYGCYCFNSDLSDPSQYCGPLSVRVGNEVYGDLYVIAPSIEVADSVVWKSSDPSILEINRYGMMAPSSIGNITITGTLLGKEYAFEVNSTSNSLASTQYDSTYQVWVDICSYKDSSSLENLSRGSKIVVDVLDALSESYAGSASQLQIQNGTLIDVLDISYSTWDDEKIDVLAEDGFSLNISIGPTDEMRTYADNTLVVYAISEDGSMSLLPTWWEEGNLCFASDSLSRIAIASVPWGTTTDGVGGVSSGSTDETQTGDDPSSEQPGDEPTGEEPSGDQTGGEQGGDNTGNQTDTQTPEPAITTQTMFRLYNSNSGEHFYTANAGEKNNLVSLGWSDEGTGWIAPTSGDPVYRLYNPNAGEHHYTTNASEKAMLEQAGWQYEGIGWYSGGDVRLYREYNPNAYANNHNYTTNKGEHDWLLSLGWKDEGYAWNAVSAS